MTFLVIATVWTFVRDFQGRATRIARLIEAPTELTGKKAAGAQNVPSGDLRVAGVGFRYQSNGALILSGRFGGSVRSLSRCPAGVSPHSPRRFPRRSRARGSR